MKMKSGFTLIELSIVLVIIGLIVGGILVGRDLIRAAEIRATISQIEKYNAAVNTFRIKYNGLPGDLQYQQAKAFGVFTFSDGTAGGVGEGDGNGLIENQNGVSGIVLGMTLNPPGAFIVDGEQYVFWRHLSDANLIDGNFGSGSNLDTSGNSSITTHNVSQFFPPAKVGNGMYFVVASDGARNYFGLAYLITVNAGFSFWGTNGPTFGLTPVDAYAIDVKLDDGLPNTGSVHGMTTDLAASAFGGPAGYGNPPQAGLGYCITGGTTFSYDDLADVYNTKASTGGTEPTCNMEFRFH